MNRLPSVAFRVAVAAIILCSGVSRMHAQAPATPPPAQEPAKAPRWRNRIRLRRSRLRRCRRE